VCKTWTGRLLDEKGCVKYIEANNMLHRLRSFHLYCIAVPVHECLAHLREVSFFGCPLLRHSLLAYDVEDALVPFMLDKV